MPSAQTVRKMNLPAGRLDGGFGKQAQYRHAGQGFAAARLPHEPQGATDR